MRWAGWKRPSGDIWRGRHSTLIKRLRENARSIWGGVQSDQPLEVGRALTKLFLVIVATLAILPQHTTEGGWSFRILAFLVSPANEIGDTFAGIAGVLAFLWIIITVWLQSQELSAQREELRLTRLEMKEQREATQDMARSMSAQAAIFEAEARQRNEHQAELLFNEHLRSLIVATDDAATYGIGWHFSNDTIDDEFGGYGEIHSYYLGSKDGGDKAIDEAIRELRQRLSGMPDHLREMLHTSVDYRLPKETKLVSGLIQKIDTILIMEESLSPPQRERLSRMRLNEIKTDLRTLLETSDLWMDPDT